MPEKFTKDKDAVLLMHSVLKRLGSGGVDTFEQRIKSQKTQYFAQLFGVSPPYKFNLYLRGPYSSLLADDLYQIERDSLKAKEEPFTPDELEDRFKKLKDFLLGKNNRQMEIVATLHWLLRVAKLEPNAAKVKLVELKEASPSEIKLAFESVKLLP